MGSRTTTEYKNTFKQYVGMKRVRKANQNTMYKSERRQKYTFSKKYLRMLQLNICRFLRKWVFHNKLV
jgi:hypothetical protein